MEQILTLDTNRTDIEYYLNHIEFFFKNDKVLENMENIKIISMFLNLENLINENKINPECSIDETLSKFENNIYVKEIFEDLNLYSKCQETFEIIKNTKPERVSKGIETWFRHEESNFF